MVGHEKSIKRRDKVINKYGNKFGKKLKLKCKQSRHRIIKRVKVNHKLRRKINLEDLRKDGKKVRNHRP